MFLWKKTDEIAKKVETFKTLRSDLEEELASVRNEAQGMIAVIDGKTAKNADAIKSLEDSFSAKIQGVKKTVGDIQLNIEANAEITADLSGKVAANKEAIAAVNKALASAKDTFTSKLTTLNNKMNYQVGNLNKKASVNADSIEGLDNKVALLSKQYNDLNLNVESMMDLMSQNFMETSNNIDKNAKDIEKAKKLASLNNRMIAENTKKIADLNSSIKKLNEQISGKISKNVSDIDAVRKTAEGASTLGMWGLIIGLTGLIVAGVAAGKAFGAF